MNADRHTQEPAADTPGRVLTATLAAVVAGGVVIRAANLGRLPMWIDECLSHSVASRSLGEIAAVSATSGSVHPPAYFLMLKGWSAVFGTSESALRSLSVLTGSAAIIATFALMQLLRRGELRSDMRPSVATAAAYAAVVSFLPEAILLSRIARGYSLLLLFWAVAGCVLACGLDSAGHRRRFLLVACGITSAALAYVHHIGAVLAGTNLAFLWSLVVLPIGAWRCSVREAAAVSLVVGTTAVPWVAVSLPAATTAPSFGSTAFDPAGVVRAFASAEVGSTFVGPFIEPSLVWMAAAATVAAVVGSAPVRTCSGRYFVLSAVLPFVAFMAVSAVGDRSFTSSRYFLVPAVSAWGAACLAIGRMPDVGLRRAAFVVAVAGVLCVNLLTAPDRSSAKADGARAVAQRIGVAGTAPRQVLAAGPSEYMKLSYYLRDTDIAIRLYRASDEPFWGQQYVLEREIVRTVRPGLQTWWVCEDHGSSERPAVPSRCERPLAFPQPYFWEHPMLLARLRFEDGSSAAVSQTGGRGPAPIPNES